MYLQKIKKARNEINEQFKGKKEKTSYERLNDFSRERESKLEKIENKKIISEERHKSRERLMDTRTKKFSIGNETNANKTINGKNKSALPLNNTIKSIKIDSQNNNPIEEKKEGSIFYHNESKNNKQFEQKCLKNQRPVPRSKKTDNEQSERSSDFSLHEASKK